MSSALSYGGGITLESLIALVTDAGWKAARIVRLTDVEAATRAHLPVPERLLGVAPRYRISANA